MDNEEFIDLLSLCVSEDEVYYYIHNHIDHYCGDNEKCYEFFMCVNDSIRDLYYNKGSSPWDDNIYDAYVDILSHLYPEFKNKFSNTGGTEVGHPEQNGGEKCILPLYMGSMNKLKSKKEILHWKSQYSPHTIHDDVKYICSAKLDGISALYANGKLYTRGNGKIGRNISYLIPFLNLNEELLKKYSVRGELIIKKETYNKVYSAEYNNSRNLVCGIMNRKYSSTLKSFYQHIDFVIYDINPIHANEPLMTFEEKFKMMKHIESSSLEATSFGLKCVDHVTMNEDIQIDNLDKILLHWKKNGRYNIDGIVISHNDKYGIVTGENPRYSFAYKNNNLCVHMVDAIVGKVLWNVSKDYYIKPKIQLYEEIKCDNSRINYVTGFNAKYICDNGICPGSKIQVGLSGNVIPHIFKVYCSGDPNFGKEDPKKYLPSTDSVGSDYVWSKNKVDLILVDKNNVYSEIKRNMIFFKSLELKCGLQETTLVNLYNSKGIYKLEDVLCLSVTEWCEAPKIGRKKAELFVSCINDTLDKKTMLESVLKKSANQNDFRNNCLDLYVKYANGSQCFDRGLGSKKLTNIIVYLNKLALKYTDEFIFSHIYDNTYVMDWSSYILQKMDIYKSKGITKTQMEIFLKGLVDFNTFMYKLRSCLMQKIKLLIIQPKDLLTHIQYKQEEKESTLNAASTSTMYNVVLTGFRNKELEEKFKQKGYVISDSVNKKTKYLIVKDSNNIGTSMKVKKAQQLDEVKIIGLNDLH